MIRIDSPWGRVYRLRNGLLLPSSTTVLKATEKKPFNKKFWVSKIANNGLTEYDASIYVEKYLARGFSFAEALKQVEQFIEQPMTLQEAEAYTAWKTAHSAHRGTVLHKFLEDTLPVGVDLKWHECPTAKDATTQKLVNSLWEGRILQQITRVHSLEQRLWYYNEEEGIGYAGTEDICYATYLNRYNPGDWKSKDPKHYSPVKYSHEYKVQLVSYAGARAVRLAAQAGELHVNFAFSNGSPGEQLIIDKDEIKLLWKEWKMRLRAWWATMGPQLKELQYV